MGPAADDAQPELPGTDWAGRRESVLDGYSHHVNSSFARLSRLIATPVESRAAGAKVHTTDGRTYLDCGGFGVFLLGHCHPVVVAAVRRQLERNPLATRLFLSQELAEAAQRLATVAPPGLDYVFLTNSGAEATELGLKLARLAGQSRVVAMHGGFHGKTLGALSVTGRPRHRDPFHPLLPGIEFVDFGDLEALRIALAINGSDTAVLLEPVQAEGGVKLPPPDYLRGVRDLCSEVGATLILDEIQTGMGRLGAWWGADTAGIAPDIMLTGKVLGGGVMPVGGVIATEQMFRPLNGDPLLHSSTYAGNPLAAAAVTATIEVIRQEGIAERSRLLGAQILDITREAVQAHCRGLVNEVRGEGLLIGVDFVSDDAATEFMMGLLDERVIPSYSLNSSNVLRLTPPAILEPADIDWLAGALNRAAKQLSTAVPTAA